jgi:hypothetical protein
MMDAIPKQGDIYIDKVPESEDARAVLRTEHGYVAHIIIPHVIHEAALGTLHEYLDELGYDDTSRYSKMKCSTCGNRISFVEPFYHESEGDNAFHHDCYKYVEGDEDIPVKFYNDMEEYNNG